MKPPALLLIVLTVCVLQGCSSLSRYTAGSRYVISNKSPGITVILYSHAAYIDRAGASICPIASMKAYPEVTTMLVRGIKPTWQKLFADQYIFNSEECSVQVAIIPGASVTIPFRERPGERPVAADSMRLTITNSDETVRLTGAEIFKRFEQIEAELYVYAFP